MQSSIPKCRTLVFFDLESTGLPSKTIPASKPKEIPRVTNRLNLCVNPAITIDPKASEITGLNNGDLEHQSPFNKETVNVILNFLQRLQKPVCLIAHNGDKFDFPLIKSEIARLGMELPPEILCADSISIFKELDFDLATDISNSVSEMNKINNGNQSNERQWKRRRNSPPSPAKPSYSLPNIYKRMFNESPDEAHHAEADVKTLMFMAINNPSRFLDKLDTNAKPHGTISTKYLILQQLLLGEMQSNVPKCNTLVFFDLETSGLPAFQVARVTELSFWAVERSQFLHTKHKAVPRVTNRLSLCVYPARLIDPAASEITGLDNYNLEHQSPFNEETANTVLGFLNRLKRPVCLIAHNGNNFDFPLLKSEIERLGKELPSHVMCCDSLPVFKELDKELAADTTCYSLSNTSVETRLVSNSEAELILNSTAVANFQFNVALSQQQQKPVNPFQYENERTPVKRRAGNQITDGHEDKRIRCSPSSASPVNKSYRLGDIYERVFNEPPETAHHAEADVKMLMLAAANYSSSFLDKLDDSAKPFASVKKLW